MHGDRRQHAGVIEVKQLAPVACPRGSRSARGRDRPAAGIDLGERTHEDLGLARLSRVIRQPTSVRRHFRTEILRGQLQQRHLFAIGSVERNREDVHPGRTGAAEQQRAGSVRRDRRRKLVSRRRGQPLDRPGSVGRLPIQVGRARHATGRPENALPVGRPLRAHVHRGIPIQGRQRFALQIQNPDVVALIPDINDDAGTVWGNPCGRINPDRRAQSLLLALPVDPYQRPVSLILSLDIGWHINEGPIA